ncbi:acyl-CoA dehydrogenase C-terminal domain-containing protein [Zavarzinia sp. CC-PAN008]|uniref:acyl-CoA dehydrogenase C-terminal domain-containing protein n=1 Tax=Zavarzinia sp. CC-PAN008 TaxID=3243332 RepID=UPI003F749ECE
MPSYKAPVRDMQFVLHDVLGIARYANLSGFSEAGADVVDAVLEEGAKIAERVLQPLNQPGDQEGCHFDNGTVTTPKGFREAYRTFVEGGWPSLTADPDYGGQGMPFVLGFAVNEMMSAANMAFSMYPGLSHGAYEAIHQHGTEEQKKLYLPHLVAGDWTGTMNLTEPHCGTDLGLMRTKAEPQADGSYRITGTKIFISAGEHDLSDNIIHLVLARIVGGPAGIKGVSLFIVPKFIPDAEGKPGARNSLAAGSIEHKMGICANATCVMNYDGATGWLIGEEHKGMRAMFTMMNAARLGVGIQGLAQAEAAYQNGAAYAKDRIQGRSLSGTKAPDKAADPIIVHPDVRRMLMTAKAFTEGARALALWTGLRIDLAHRDPDTGIREANEDVVALVTPVVKGFLTDKGFEVAVMAQQCLGGHGYIKEWGLEQFVRDARIAQIYEGTNGVQALDLVGRKLPANGGRAVMALFGELHKHIAEREGNADLAPLLPPFKAGVDRLQQGTMWLMQNGLSNPENAGAASTDYLHLFGLVALGYMWLQMAETAQAKLKEGTGDAAFYEAKLVTARFFMERMLPDTAAHLAKLESGAANLMALGEDQFGAAA